MARQAVVVKTGSKCLGDKIGYWPDLGGTGLKAMKIYDCHGCLHDLGPGSDDLLGSAGHEVRKSLFLQRQPCIQVGTDRGGIEMRGQAHSLDRPKAPGLKPPRARDWHRRPISTDAACDNSLVQRTGPGVTAIPVRREDRVLGRLLLRWRSSCGVAPGQIRAGRGAVAMSGGEEVMVARSGPFAGDTGRQAFVLDCPPKLTFATWSAVIDALPSSASWR